MSIILPTEILALLQIYGYPLVLVLMFFEGPIVTYISAFLASQGVFNIYLIFALSILGNFIPDLILFSIGRFGNKKILKNRYHLSRLKGLFKIISYVEEHPLRSIAIIKLVPPLPAPGLILAGTTKISFKKYALIALLVGIPYSIFFTIMGYYSGIAFNIVSKYIKYTEIILLCVIIFYILILIIFNKIMKKIAKKEEKYLKNK